MTIMMNIQCWPWVWEKPRPLGLVLPYSLGKPCNFHVATPCDARLKHLIMLLCAVFPWCNWPHDVSMLESNWSHHLTCVYLRCCMLLMQGVAGLKSHGFCWPLHTMVCFYFFYLKRILNTNPQECHFVFITYLAIIYCRFLSLWCLAKTW